MRLALRMAAANPPVSLAFLLFARYAHAMRHGPPFFHSRRGYHHGSLKETLLEAARRLIGERGASGFTLSDAAKLAGVTPAALYRHFTDRSALIGELRQRGFELFTQKLEAAWNDGKPEARVAFERMGLAYQHFAREEPGLYTAMFGHATGFLPADATFRPLLLLENAAAAVLRDCGVEKPDGRTLALQIWSLSHGVATLAASGQLSPAYCFSSPEAMVQDAVSALFEAHVRRAFNTPLDGVKRG